MLTVRKRHIIRTIHTWRAADSGAGDRGILSSATVVRDDLPIRISALGKFPVNTRFEQLPGHGNESCTLRLVASTRGDRAHMRLHAFPRTFLGATRCSFSQRRRPAHRTRRVPQASAKGGDGISRGKRPAFLQEEASQTNRDQAFKPLSCLARMSCQSGPVVPLRGLSIDLHSANLPMALPRVNRHGEPTQPT